MKFSEDISNRQPISMVFVKDTFINKQPHKFQCRHLSRVGFISKVSAQHAVNCLYTFLHQVFCHGLWYVLVATFTGAEKPFPFHFK